MAIPAYTTKDISDNIIAQFETEFGQTVPILPKAFLRVLSRVLGGVFILLYKYGGYMFLQQFVQTASIKDTTILGVVVSPLKFWGRLIGVGDPDAATNAEHTIDITVTNQTGSLPAGTQFVHTSSGVIHILTSAVALSSSTVSGTIKAVSDQTGTGGAGTIGNLTAGDIVSFVNPIPNVSRNAEVTAQTVTGADAEDTEVYRQRVLDRFQRRPQGGAYADYEAWGAGVAGVLNVYPYTSTYPGQVDVYVESSTETDGIPTTAQLTAVLDAINYDDTDGLATRRPAGCFVNTFAITRTEFDITISGVSTDNDVQAESDIEDALTEYLLTREPYIVGLHVPPRKDQITAAAIGGIIQDIVAAAGGTFSYVEVSVSSVGVDLYTLGEGEKAKLGTLSFI